MMIYSYIANFFANFFSSFFFLSQIFGGMTTDNMHELLYSGLKNDTQPETMRLKYKVNGVVFPCQYIKIGKPE